MERLDPFPPSVASDVSCHFLGPEAILFSEDSQRLYRLNTTAAFIWCCCEDKLAPEAIARAVADAFGISALAAQRDVAETLAAWQALGLLTGGPIGPTAPVPPIGDEPPAVEFFYTDPIDSAAWCEHHYRLLDACVQVRLPSAEAAQSVHPILAHLATPSGVPFDTTLTILEDGQGYVLLREGAAVARCSGLTELGPLVHAHFLLAAYEAANCLIAIHAAAIVRSGRCILLPGDSGSGKSTLTAALLDSPDWVYLTDELALLARDTHCIRPAPVSLSLKEGAWPVLTPLHPVVDKLPVHLRSDGRTVRYLPPPREALPEPDDLGYPVQYIVFPRYRADSESALTALSPADALCRLTEAGYHLHGRLDTVRVGELVRWITALPCYELRFGSLPHAAAQVEVLLP